MDQHGLSERRAGMPVMAPVVVGTIPLVWFVAMGISRRGDAPTIMAFAAGILCALLLLTRTFDLRLLVPDAKNVAIGAAGAMVMLGITYGGFFTIARFFPSLRVGTAVLYAHLSAGRSNVAAAFIVTGIVIAEEIVWRGAFQTLVSWYVAGSVRQVVVVSIVYAAALASFGSPLLVLTGLVCGLYWSGLRSWSGSIVPPLVAHVLWDFVLAVVPLS